MISKDISFEEFPYKFIRNENSKKLLVFLPAVNSKDIYPYYPRVSWGKELSEKCNVLYIADPFQHLPEYKEPMGSWFVSPEGNFVLPKLARLIKDFSLLIDVEDVIFYGSSMGGFAAIVLSSLIEGSTAIAECPQLLLDKHPGSKYVIENIIDSESLPLFNVENYLTASKANKVKIICSYYDRHYFNHILPFFDNLIKSKFKSNTKISFHGYLDSSYNDGHVSLRKDDAYLVIDAELGVGI